MGTQQSSRASGGLPLRQFPGNSSPLRSLGIEEADSPFASPPRVWHNDEAVSSSCSPKVSTRWQRSLCQAPSPATSSTYGDLEAGNSDIMSESPDMVINDGRSLHVSGADALIQDDAPAGKPSRARLRSFGSPHENSAPTLDVPRPSLARGSSTARPRWSRPRPSTAGGREQANGSSPISGDTMSLSGESSASFHPHSLASELKGDETDRSHVQWESLSQLASHKADKEWDAPPTPSTISDAGFNSTQSSFSSTSGWKSRPTTCSSASSSGPFRSSSKHSSSLVIPEDCHEVLIDCSRDSRMRASGAQTPSGNYGETLQRLSSLRTAWGDNMVDELSSLSSVETP